MSKYDNNRNANLVLAKYAREFYFDINIQGNNKEDDHIFVGHMCQPIKIDR